MKRIAALTMVRNDERFLRKWVEYYSACLGAENLYVFLDGLDQPVPGFCSGVNCRAVDHNSCAVHEGDRLRAAFLSARAAELFASGYDMVLGTDVDEFLVVDPLLGKTLPEYLSDRNIGTSLSALGLDFGQRIGEEPDLDWSRGFLEQRHYAQIGTRYTKPSVVGRPCVWGSGFHRIKGHNFHIGKGLYLMHFGYCDRKFLESRYADPDRLSQGWGSHMHKRSRTIRYATSLKERDFDRWTTFGRVCQSIFRPPYALNKPAMFELRIVVRIPERFRHIL